MSLLKYIALGAAVAYGISYVTKKREEDGKSLVDDLSEQAPEWMDKIKQYGQDALQEVSQRTQEAKTNF